MISIAARMDRQLTLVDGRQARSCAWSLRWQLALRQALDPGKGCQLFYRASRLSGIALAIALLLAVQSVMNGFDREMRERILALMPTWRSQLTAFYRVAATAV